MKHLLILLLLLFISCSSGEESIYFDRIPETKVIYSQIEMEILVLVNDYRVKKSMNELVTLNFISSVALTHTLYMVNRGVVSHDNFPERYQNLILYASAKEVGENVAYGHGTAAGVVRGWTTSKKHIVLMEEPDYTHFGISVEPNREKRNYFTLIFIKK